MDNTVWEIIGKIILVLEIGVMISFFRRPPSESQKALLVGLGFFLITIFFNIIALTKVSEYFAVLGFIIISLALIRLFWTESKK